MRQLPFGTLPTGQSVESYTLENDMGASVTVITYGGIVTHLRMPDRDGHVEDVCLGFSTLAPYLAGHPYFGAIVGRVAGRVSGGGITLEGKFYPLVRNDHPNHLHGGAAGLDKRLWAAEPVPRADGAQALRLVYRSPAGEEGYPGNADLTVTYTLTPACELIIETEVSVDEVTPISLTHHSYFNLAGEGSGSVHDHLLEIPAAEYFPTDKSMTLLGRKEPVSAEGNDFRTPRRLEDAIPGLFLQHGDLYQLPAARPGAMQGAARLSHPASGRTLTVSTTEDCLQLYTGASLDGSLTGKSGRLYGPHAGLCLECEGYPDAMNSPALGHILVQPGQPQRHRTIYAFSTL